MKQTLNKKYIFKIRVNLCHKLPINPEKQKIERRTQFKKEKKKGAEESSENTKLKPNKSLSQLSNPF